MALIPMEYDGGGIDVFTKPISGLTNQFGAIAVISDATKNFPLNLPNTSNERCVFFAAYDTVYAQFYQIDNGVFKVLANTQISGTLYYTKQA